MKHLALPHLQAMLVEDEADLLQDRPFISSSIPPHHPKVDDVRQLACSSLCILIWGPQTWFLPTNNTNPSTMCLPSSPAVSFPFQFQFRLRCDVYISTLNLAYRNMWMAVPNVLGIWTERTSPQHHLPHLHLSSTPFLPPLRDRQHPPSNRNPYVGIPPAIRSRLRWL